MAAFKMGVQSDGSWHVYAGDTNKERVEFFAGGLPWDLTGAVITAQARLKDTDAAPALTASIEMTDPPAGVIHIAWDGEAIRTLLAGESSWTGEYDIQVVQGGITKTVARNKLIAAMDITRP